VTRTHTVPINWRPERATHQRYTVSVSPFRLASNGIKFDFERELTRPGHWFGTSLAVYIASPRNNRYAYGGMGNNHSSFLSSWDSYHRMWGVGSSAMFKNTFSPRGWYFSTGMVAEFFRVGVVGDRYEPYVEEGLTYYHHTSGLETRSYLKPTLQFNIGKHMALSQRIYLDVFGGLGLSYSLHRRAPRSYYDTYYDWYDYQPFSEIGGFAYRGLVFTGGFRVGVLLWK
jgi:hypothetical protein